ncbi:MAG TPA: glycosyl hydrolase [Verrucomicrobiae bacterium]|nr:glycosyl hydrolase [Verrucomicrobiae bacterium]
MKFLFGLLPGALVFCGLHASAQTANPDANEKARAVLAYIHSLEPRTDKRVLSGQFSNFGDHASLRLVNQIHEQSGHWPAILGVDYLGGRAGIRCDQADRAAIDYWNQGGLVTVSTHLYDPTKTWANVPGGLRDRDVDLNTLLDTNTEAHTNWMHELDLVADGLTELKTNGVVVLWRPFHEMNGDWFWWNGKDPDTFIKLWRQMFDYFTQTRKLDNLLWVYGPNHGKNTAAYYPGDQYVDIVGLDAYTDFVDTDHIRGYPQVAKINKPFGFSEFGPHGASDPPGDFDYTNLINGIRANFPRTVFFMSWNAKWSLASNSNVTALLNDPWIVNREDLPKGLAGAQQDSGGR